MSKLKVFVFLFIGGLLILGATMSIAQEESENVTGQELLEATPQGDEGEIEEELEEVPSDLTEIALPKIYLAKGVRPSLLITPAGIAKITRAKVLSLEGDLMKIKVWGMEFRIDVSEAKVVKKPFWRCPLGRRCIQEGLKVIHWEDAKIKEGDFVSVIGRVKDFSSYPILIKAKVVKNLSRLQPIPRRIMILREKEKEKVEKEVKEKVLPKKTYKRARNLEEIRLRIQEVLRRIRELQANILRAW